MAVEGAADFWEGVPFTDEVWAEIYETIKEGRFSFLPCPVSFVFSL